MRYSTNTRQDEKDDLVRKKGVWRFLEVLSGNFRDLIKINLLFCLCVLPSVAAFILGLFGFYSVYMYVLALLAALSAGGALSSCVFCISKMLRDEPGYVWHDFRRKFNENMKQAAVPGVLCAAFVYMQVLVWGSMIGSEVGIDAVWVIMGAVVLLIFGMVAPYVFLQFAYIDLGVPQILKNSILISFMNAPRSAMGAVCGGAIWLVFALFLPGSLIFAPLFLLIGFSLSCLLCLMWVWPPVDKQFSIEETLRSKQEER